MLEFTTTIPYDLAGYLYLADAVIITDSEHTIAATNKPFETITGYSQEEIIGLKPGFLKSNFTPFSTYTSLKTNLNERRPWSGVFINRKKSGELWHSSITITPILINNILYFVGVFRELEQLKQGLYISENKRVEVHQEILKVMAISCEIRDPGITDHLIRVQNLTRMLVTEHNKRLNLNLPKMYLNNIVNASILHDIGKAGIPEGILYKPGPLTTYERKIIEMHPLMGTDILQKISIGIDKDFTKSLETAENIIAYHHEKWDGTGYPHHLIGEKIPFEARAVAVVDVFDALTSRRTYKDSWPVKDALNFILAQKGTHFDPQLVDTLNCCLLGIHS